MKRTGAMLLVGGTFALALMGDPGIEQQLEWRAAELQARLDAGAVQVEPAELLALMHDRSTRLRIADLRGEADWNWLHLVDAERVVDPATWGQELESDEIVILVDQDGSRAVAAWQTLNARLMPNCYLLDGGMDAWLEEFGTGDDPLAALGDRHPAALPDLPEDLEYTRRVRRIGPAPVIGGGCG